MVFNFLYCEKKIKNVCIENLATYLKNDKKIEMLFCSI